jgi:hypothetical protein
VTFTEPPKEKQQRLDDYLKIIELAEKGYINGDGLKLAEYYRKKVPALEREINGEYDSREINMRD